MPSVLVTGAAGFVGASVVRRFAEAGYSVVAVDRSPADERLHAYLREHLERIAFVRADICDPAWSRALPGDFEGLAVHAAAVTNTAPDEETARAADAVAVNVGGTVNVVRWASTARVSRLVYTGSGSIYGSAGGEGPSLDEDTVPLPRMAYAITKLAAERLAVRLAELSGLDLVVARLPSQFGPMERTTPDRTRLSIFQAWCRAALAGDEIVANRKQRPRDYTYVYDVADALYALATQFSLAHRLYNISGGSAVTSEEIVDALRESFPDLRVRYVDDDTPALNDRLPASPKRLHDDTGWTPRFGLAKGLTEYIAWLRTASA